jgi:hypothetical protein
MTMQLAQLNIGKFRGAKGDPAMAYFFENLDRVNALAERMPGFVWRLKDETGNATDIPWAGDASFAVNMSVWDSVEALESFVWKTVHAKVYERKAEFFEKYDAPHFVMWWVEDGHIPTLAEANERLERYRNEGPSEAAFGWADLPAAKLWQEKRCA